MRIANAVCWSWMVLSTLPAVAQTRLLGVLGGNAVQSADAGAVVEIDPATGLASPLATPIPGESLTGIAALPDGRVFVSTADISGSPRLLEIDPQTGDLLNIVGVFTDGTAPVVLHDLAGDPTTGMLYGASVGADLTAKGGSPEGSTSVNAIFTIDPATAVATFVGTPSPLTGGFLAIAFANDGTLWGKVSNAPELYRIDKGSGAILDTVTLAPASAPWASARRGTGRSSCRSVAPERQAINFTGSIG